MKETSRLNKSLLRYISLLYVSSLMAITTVCFECNAEPSVFSEEGIWAIIKKVADH